MYCMPLLVFRLWVQISQKSVCNGCHDLLMLCLNISEITIITAKGIDYRCIIYDINKSDAIRLLEISVLDDHEYI